MNAHDIFSAKGFLRLGQLTAGVVIFSWSLLSCGPQYGGTTDYVKANPNWTSPYGYSDKQIGNDEFSVVATGNPDTPKQRVAEIALLRAAHLTREKGRSHFIILKQKNQVMGAVESASLPLGGLFVWIPVGTVPTEESTAILLIRLLPVQDSYPVEAILADEVIKSLAEKLE